MSHVAPLRVGSIEVSVVCYGFAPLDLADECPGHDVDWPAERARYPWAFHDRTSWTWHVHAFVVSGPWGTALIDTGLGAYPPFRPWADGAHVGADEAFERAGLDVGSVGLVVLSHVHADHAGGVWAGERPRFPDARHLLHEADLASFADGHEAYAAVREMRLLAELDMLDLDPSDREVAPGMRVVHTPGHTPGHRSVILDAGSERLLITGDLLHVPVQAAHPMWRSNHDEDPETGSSSRAALLRRAANGRWLVGVPHFARPFGRVVVDGWRPVSEGDDVGPKDR